MQEERVRQFVLQALSELSGTKSEAAYLVDLRIKGPQRGRKIEIIADTDAGIRISQCAKVSRRIREMIENDSEALSCVGEDFELMVSSPGLGEPLKFPRQYIRHSGKLLRVTYTDESGVQSELFGRLVDLSLSDESRQWIMIMPEKKRSKGAKNDKNSVTLYLDQIVRSVPEAEL